MSAVACARGALPTVTVNREGETEISCPCCRVVWSRDREHAFESWNDEVQHDLDTLDAAHAAEEQAWLERQPGYDPDAPAVWP